MEPTAALEVCLQYPTALSNYLNYRHFYSLRALFPVSLPRLGWGEPKGDSAKAAIVERNLTTVD